jgi:NAD(P)-dependent dehydrogenase (short-subunit alcohol dehydrogenase family)
VHEITAEEIKRVVQVTMLGQIYGMKAALEQMRPHRSGVIINVASALRCVQRHSRPLIRLRSTASVDSRSRCAWSCSTAGCDLGIDATSLVHQHAAVPARTFQDGRAAEADPSRAELLSPVCCSRRRVG